MSVFNIAGNQMSTDFVGAITQHKAQKASIRAQEIANNFAEKELANYEADRKAAEAQAQQKAQAQKAQQFTEFMTLASPLIKAGNRDGVQALGEKLFPEMATDGIDDAEWEQVTQMAASFDREVPTTERERAISGLIERGAISQEEADQISLQGLQGTQQRKSDYTLNGVRYDGQTNQPIAGTPGGSKQTNRDKKIQDRMDLGWSREQAVKDVDGLVTTEFNPKNGKLVRIDRTNPDDVQVEELEIGSEEADEELGIGKSGEPSLYQLAGLGTGVTSAIKALGGKIPYVPVDHEVEYARSQLTSSVQSLIRSLANNKRYPVGEYNRLREEINIEPKFWDKPEAMRIRMVSISDYLKGEVERHRDYSDNPNTSQKMREAADEAIRDIESYLAKLQLPPVVRSDEDFENLEPGTVFLNSEDGYREYRK